RVFCCSRRGATRFRRAEPLDPPSPCHAPGRCVTLERFPRGRTSPGMPEDQPPTGTAQPGPAAGPGHDTPTPPPSAGHTVGAGSLPTTLPAKFGRYELLQVLGKGGMGAVYLATDTHLNRRVALKVPHLAGADPDSARVLHDRFLREARLAASLTHPNLCPVHDCGE